MKTTRKTIASHSKNYTAGDCERVALTQINNLKKK